MQLVVCQWGQYNSVIHFDYGTHKSRKYILGNEEIVKWEELLEEAKKATK